MSRITEKHPKHGAIGSLDTIAHTTISWMQHEDNRETIAFLLTSLLKGKSNNDSELQESLLMAAEEIRSWRIESGEALKLRLQEKESATMILNDICNRTFSENVMYQKKVVDVSSNLVSLKKQFAEEKTAYEAFSGMIQADLESRNFELNHKLKTLRETSKETHDNDSLHKKVCETKIGKLCAKLFSTVTQLNHMKKKVLCSYVPHILVEGES